MAGSLAPLRFVPLDPSHVAPILEIEREANTAPWSEKSFLNELTNPHSIFLVALLDGRVVGYGGVWLIIDEAHVTNVAVEVDQRRNGVGRRLVVELMKRAKTQGMVCSTLEVRAGNEAAIALYETLGFETVATRKGYYPDNKEDALVMWLHHLDEWEPPR